MGWRWRCLQLPEIWVHVRLHICELLGCLSSERSVTELFNFIFVLSFFLFCGIRLFCLFIFSYLFVCFVAASFTAMNYMWPSTGKPGTTRHPSKKIFLHLRSCRRPDIELSKFYRRSLSRSLYNRPNRSLPSAWNNTFLEIDRSFLDIYARRVVPGFPVDGHIYSLTVHSLISLFSFLILLQIHSLTHSFIQ